VLDASPPPVAASPPGGRRRATLGLLLVALLNGLLLWHFHDRYWYPTDDGFYSNLAERLLGGETLNRDIQDIHPGYIHFVHAAAMKLFGVDMVSLRYPLALASWVYALAVYVLLRERGVLLAAAGSFAATALGVLQFFNPTPNWYCLCLTAVVAWWLMSRPPGTRGRLLVAGLLVGVITMFRQLTGVWVAMGVLAIALSEQDEPQRPRSVAVSRGLFVLMLAALLWYLLVSPHTEVGGTLLIATWPITILVWGAIRTRAPDAAAARVAGQLGAGALATVIPLLVYHAAHGSLQAWFSDNVLVAFGETQMWFFGAEGWYGLLTLVAFNQAATSFDLVKIANGIYWVILMLVFSANGLLILRHLRRDGGLARMTLPVIAAFTAMVSMYLEGPLYLYYTVGFVVAALLWAPRARAAGRAALAAMAIFLGVVGIEHHACQLRLRNALEILEGHRVADVWTTAGRGPLPRASLAIEDKERESYARVVALIQAEVLPSESIWALPNDAELYFLADRRNPLRFYNSALGLSDERAVQGLLEQLADDPPRLVLYRHDDKYNTPAVRKVMDAVRRRYEPLETLEGLDIYRLPRS